MKVSDPDDQFPDSVGCATLLGVTETATTRKTKEKQVSVQVFQRMCSTSRSVMLWMYLRTAIEGDFEDRPRGSLNNCLYLPARTRPTGDDDAFQRPPERRRTLVKQTAGKKPFSPGVSAGSRADPRGSTAPNTRRGVRMAAPNWRLGRPSANQMSAKVEVLGISLGDSRFL